MDTIFVVQHMRSDEGGEEDVKLIGVYSSRENAESVVSRYKKLKGFRAYPDGFSIDEYQLDKDYWKEGFSE